ncbi:MAG TPA: glycosyltransferase [Solirubrobacteraceae bacterium]|jgi:glycosyltransferase involved in cell wall biosynthesis|nr:glycosyltransferase [Solirubrobacteraceae bacterium]
MPGQPRLHGRQIVCVGFADWQTELWTNQHHLMSRLAQDNDVLFVESLGLRQPQLAGRDLARMSRRLRRGLAPPRATDGLHVLSPLVVPAHRYAAVRRLNARLLPLLVRRAARRLGMSRPILWGYAPQAEVLVETLDPSLIVYHCVDDIAAQRGVDAASFRAAEQRFAGSADLVLASSRPLAARLRELSGNVLYAPNVADVELFCTALDAGPGDEAMQALPHPRIVFTGAIVQTKLDFDLIRNLARMRRDWSIALVGPIGPGDPSTDVSGLRAEPNVHLLGHRPHAQLPAVLREADVAFIPYAINPLTESVFPMKVYEYLAAGLAVVSTPLPSLNEVSEVRLGTSAGEVADLLERALADNGQEARAARSQASMKHSWSCRLQEIAVAMQALRPRAPSCR